MARIVALGVGLAISLILAACGDKEPQLSKATEAGAISLKEAMDSSSRAIDGARETRGSLDRVAASLQSSVDQTGDVIAVMTANATAPAERDILAAARFQRTYLQSAKDGAASRVRGSALAAIARARDAGRKASDSYVAAAKHTPALAGLVPASSTFNTGRLRDLVLKLTTVKKKETTPTPTPGGGPSVQSSGTECGGGVSVNSVTSCPFGRNVASEYGASGGSSVIEVYSPVTKETYTMLCSGGAPVVCTGGNGAIVTIR